MEKFEIPVEGNYLLVTSLKHGTEWYRINLLHVDQSFSRFFQYDKLCGIPETASKQYISYTSVKVYRYRTIRTPQFEFITLILQKRIMLQSFEATYVLLG